MDKGSVIAWLQSLTDKQFVEFFYEAVADRHIYSEERDLWDAHLVLVNAIRDRKGSGPPGQWEVQLVCPTPQT